VQAPWSSRAWRCSPGRASPARRTTALSALPIWEAWDADLSGYDALILDTTGPVADPELLWDAEGFAAEHHFPGLLDYRPINEFIERGGAVIIRGRWAWPEDCPLFPVAGGGAAAVRRAQRRAGLTPRPSPAQERDRATPLSL